MKYSVFGLEINRTFLKDSNKSSLHFERALRRDIHHFTNNLEHDFIGTAANRSQPPVAIGLADGILGSETHTTPELKTRISHLTD